MTQETQMAEIIINQLSGFWESWKKDMPRGDIAFGMLSCIGYLRRAGEGRRKLREIEIEVRHHLETILDAFGAFMEGSTLLELAAKMQENPEDNILNKFFDERDNSELAWQIAKEYTEEEYPHNWGIIGNIRDFLDKVDDMVLLNKDMVMHLRQIGNLRELIYEMAYCDPEFFWWFPHLKKGCYLPHRRRDEYIADSEVKADFLRHLLSCPDCQERRKMSKEMIAEQSLLETISFRPMFACAALEENPEGNCFIWLDDEGKWEVRLSIENSSFSSSEQKLYWDIRNRTQKKYNWQGIELQWGQERLKISEDGYAQSTREQIENGLKEGNSCILCFSDGKKIFLNYKGKKDDQEN